MPFCCCGWPGPSISPRCTLSPFDRDGMHCQTLGEGRVDPGNLERYRTRTGNSHPFGPDSPTVITRTDHAPCLSSPSPISRLIDHLLSQTEMSLEQLYSRAAKSLESQGDYSLSAYSSTDLDRVQFDSYPPSTMFGDTSTFSGVLNILRPQFALEASSPCIRAAIDSRWVVRGRVAS